jgi:hypothetical protein
LNPEFFLARSGGELFEFKEVGLKWTYALQEHHEKETVIEKSTIHTHWEVDGHRYEV